MTTKAASFLMRHNFPVGMDVGAAAGAILNDMRQGLSGKKAGQDMIRTWMLPPSSRPKNERVIVIDAGGTNFRSCLVSFDDDGCAAISDFKKDKMPGVERELSKAEFFAQIADNIEHLRDKADKIGFCFSYSMKITEDGDGIPNGFSKEVKAPEVIGVPVGKTLLETLSARGWKSVSRVTLLNDTVAALLAGKAATRAGAEYSAYIGFILGTGMNAAYVQPADSSLGIEKQIVVCESGKCGDVPLSDFDKAVDAGTNIPGQYLLEKGCSGAYLGRLGGEMLSVAVSEGLFSDGAAQAVKALGAINTVEMNEFLHSPFGTGRIAVAFSGACEDDRLFACEILDAAVDRTARYAAAILSSNAIQSGGGKSSLRPVAMLCNGTTFFKTYRLRERTEAYLQEYLVGKCGIHFEILCADDDITLGTAVGALS